MPVISNVVRQNAPIGVRRADVKAGQAFRMVKRDGSLGKETYGCISQNGKYYSVNFRTGELASSQNGDKQVKLVGSFEIRTNMFLNGQRRATTRANVKDNEVFTVKGGRNVYANLGKTMERKHIALNLGNENHAVTTKDSKRVVVLGTYTVHVNVVRA